MTGAIRPRKAGEDQKVIWNTYYTIGADAYMDYLKEKYATIEANEQRWENVQTDDAEIVLVAYGISSRVCKAAVKKARAQGIKLGLIRPITLWPYPKKAFDALGDQVKGFLVVEMSILARCATTWCWPAATSIRWRATASSQMSRLRMSFSSASKRC